MMGKDPMFLAFRNGLFFVGPTNGPGPGQEGPQHTQQSQGAKWLEGAAELRKKYQLNGHTHVTWSSYVMASQPTPPWRTPTPRNKGLIRPCVLRETNG